MSSLHKHIDHKQERSSFVSFYYSDSFGSFENQGVGLGVKKDSPLPTFGSGSLGRSDNFLGE